MRYVATTKDTDFQSPSWKEELFVFAFRLATLWLMPLSNPDHEPLYPKVRKWLLEIDETGQTCREVALGEGDALLFAAPVDGNVGFWTDSDYRFSDDELEPVDRDAFEQYWARYEWWAAMSLHRTGISR